MNTRASVDASTNRRLFGVLVTFRRPADLSTSLRCLAQQERPLDRLLVVDNSPSPQNETNVRAYEVDGLPVDYVAMSANAGPAGGFAEGMERILEFADDRDWIVLFDDDDPPPSAMILGELERFAEAMLRKDPETAAVGLVGARFDWKRGRVLRVPDAELVGPVAVDFIGGNNVPFYLARAIRSVGPFSRDVFFGLEELEQGLRLRRAGYSIYVDGPRWRERRGREGRLGLEVAPERRLPELSWRRYYSLRNAIYILRSSSKRRVALRVTLERGLAKPLVNLPVAPKLALRHLALNMRACRDGWTGRMGRTVEPEEKVDRR